MISQTLAGISRGLLDLVYPPCCVLCGDGGSFLCDTCRSRLPRAGGLRCNRCWLPLRSRAGCYACSERELSLDRLRSVFRYEGDVRRLVHAFEFSGQSSLAPALAQQMLECYRDAHLEADVIVPVPLKAVRRRRRGFNQALLLARELSKSLELPCIEALRRQGSASPQAQSPSAEERRRNVTGAFVVDRPGEVAGRAVLLVDDVATTGATLSACADELRREGAAAVLGLTLARED
jgi:competence protein ComFC